MRKFFQFDNAAAHSNMEILYEDNHLLAINKPAGLLVQGDQTGDTCLVDCAKEYLKVKYNKPGKVYVGLVHRLDRPVSGVVLLTKTSKALTRMNRIFTDRKVGKLYWAVTANAPPNESDTLTHWLRKNSKKNRTTSFHREAKGSKLSQLDYSLIMVRNRKFLLEVIPLTGRAHQIRVQLSAVGCPIVGDVKYGYKGNPARAIGLHAKRLHFEHPVKKEPLTIEARLPSTPYWKPFLDLA